MKLLMDNLHSVAEQTDTHKKKETSTYFVSTDCLSTSLRTDTQ